MASINYLSLLNNLYRRVEELSEEMPSVARCMRLIGLSAEAMEVKNIFENDALKRVNDGPTLDVDIEVDYEEWAHKEWPVLEIPPKSGLYQNPERYFKEEQNGLNTYGDRLLDFYPNVEYEEKIEIDNEKGVEKYKEEVKKTTEKVNSFKAHEQVRTIVGLAHAGTIMQEYHLLMAVNNIIEKLKPVLWEISKKLATKYNDEKYEKLYEDERTKNLPQTLQGKNDFEFWVEDSCYGKPSLDDLESYRINILLELFKTGIFANQVNKTQRTQKKDGEINFDSLDDEDKKGLAWKNYYELRKFFKYEDGGLILSDVDKVGRLFYNHRKDANAKELREAFFVFESKLRHAQEELSKQRTVNRVREEMLTKKRMKILDKIDEYIERGDWVRPATVDSIKKWMRTVLNIGDKKLEGDDLKMSKALWHLFESRKGDATMVTFQNIVGYLHYYGLLPKKDGAPQLQVDIFGENDRDKYTNIDKGKPKSEYMPDKFKAVIPLLDKYREAQFRESL